MKIEKIKVALARLAIGGAAVILLVSVLFNGGALLFFGIGWKAFVVGFLWGVPFAAAFLAIFLALAWVVGSFE